MAILNKLVYVKTYDKFSSELQSQYQNSIVFIEDKKIIWTHGKEFGLSDTEFQDLKGRVDSLESVKWFDGIAEAGSGKSVYKAQDGSTTIKFQGDDDTITVTVSEDGVKISGTPVTAESGNSYLEATAESNEVTVTAKVTKMSEITGLTTGEGTLADAADIKKYVDDKVIKAGDDADNTEEIEKIITAVGLDSDGSHKETEGNYTSSASTITEEIDALDTQLKINSDKITTVEGSLNSHTSKFTDSKTIKEDSGKYETNLSIKYIAKSGENKAQVALVDGLGSTISKVDVSDIIGNGVVTASSYNETNGELTLTFGDAGSHVVNLGKLLDINDILIDTSSSDYLDVSVEGESDGKAKISVKLGDISSGSAGLVNASSVKSYVEGKITSLSKESGETKGTNVSVTYKEEEGVVTIEKIDETYAVVNTSDSVTVTTPTGLVKGSDLKSVATYLEDKIESAVDFGDLDAEITSSDGTNVVVKVSEVDGKITEVSVKETYSTVSANTNFSVTSESGLITGTDLKATVNYLEEKITKGVEDLDSTVTKQDSKNFVTVKTTIKDGLLEDSNSSVAVTYGSYGDSITDGIASVNDTKTYIDNIISWVTIE